MLAIPNCVARAGSSSTFTFPTFKVSDFSAAISSIIGDSILQGPHQVAQKSTSTGLVEFKTSSLKFDSLIFTSIISSKIILIYNKACNDKILQSQDLLSGL